MAAICWGGTRWRKWEEGCWSWIAGGGGISGEEWERGCGEGMGEVDTWRIDGTDPWSGFVGWVIGVC